VRLSNEGSGGSGGERGLRGGARKAALVRDAAPARRRLAAHRAPPPVRRGNERVPTKRVRSRPAALLLQLLLMRLSPGSGVQLLRGCCCCGCAAAAVAVLLLLRRLCSCCGSGAPGALARLRGLGIAQGGGAGEDASAAHPPGDRGDERVVLAQHLGVSGGRHAQRCRRFGPYVDIVVSLAVVSGDGDSDHRYGRVRRDPADHRVAAIVAPLLVVLVATLPNGAEHRAPRFGVDVLGAGREGTPTGVDLRSGHAVGAKPRLSVRRGGRPREGYDLRGVDRSGPVRGDPVGGGDEVPIGEGGEGPSVRRCQRVVASAPRPVRVKNSLRGSALGLEIPYERVKRALAGRGHLRVGKKSPFPASLLASAALGARTSDNIGRNVTPPGVGEFRVLAPPQAVGHRALRGAAQDAIGRLGAARAVEAELRPLPTNNGRVQLRLLGGAPSARGRAQELGDGVQAQGAAELSAAEGSVNPGPLPSPNGLGDHLLHQRRRVSREVVLVADVVGDVTEVMHGPSDAQGGGDERRRGARDSFPDTRGSAQALLGSGEVVREGGARPPAVVHGGGPKTDGQKVGIECGVGPGGRGAVGKQEHQVD
jgi:hypothetical protein